MIEILDLLGQGGPVGDLAVAGDDDRLIIAQLHRLADRALPADGRGPCRFVDERVQLVEQQIAHVQDIEFGEEHDDVVVGVTRAVVSNVQLQPAGADVQLPRAEAVGGKIVHGQTFGERKSCDGGVDPGFTRPGLSKLIKLLLGSPAILGQIPGQPRRQVLMRDQLAVGGEFPVAAGMVAVMVGVDQ